LAGVLDGWQEWLFWEADGIPGAAHPTRAMLGQVPLPQCPWQLLPPMLVVWPLQPVIQLPLSKGQRMAFATVQTSGKDHARGLPKLLLLSVQTRNYPSFRSLIPPPPLLIRLLYPPFLQMLPHSPRWELLPVRRRALSGGHEESQLSLGAHEEGCALPVYRLPTVSTAPAR
jgi:hypothetical protein